MRDGRRQFLIGTHQQGFAAHDVLAVLGRENLRPGTERDHALDRRLTGGRQRQQVAIDAHAHPGRHPLLIGIDRASLHPDRDHLAVETRQRDVRIRQRQPPAPLVDQAIAHQREDRADLHLAELVGVRLVLVDGEIAARHAISAIEGAAVGRERTRGPRLDHGAVVEAERPRLRLALEQQVERALRRKPPPVRLPLARDRLQDRGRMPRGGAQHLVQRERLGRRGRPQQHRQKKHEPPDHFFTFATGSGV